MNYQQPMGFQQPRREGFIEGDDANKPAVEAKVIDAEPVRKMPRTMPPPEIEPSPAELPPQAATEWPMTVKLINKPIKNNRGETVHEITLREPRAGDINRYGNPVRFNSEGDPVYDERKMTYMIAALADILPPFIEDMHPRDWNTIALKLRNFFLPDPRGW
jgi:Phage tail assembly chaperone proteins, E, or 41 or 14